MPLETIKEIKVRDTSDSSFTTVTVELPDGRIETWKVANYDATDTSGRRINRENYRIDPVDLIYLPIINIH